jgi:hypothetical protein
MKSSNGVLSPRHGEPLTPVVSGSLLLSGLPLTAKGTNTAPSAALPGSNTDFLEESGVGATVRVAPSVPVARTASPSVRTWSKGTASKEL